MKHAVFVQRLEGSMLGGIAFFCMISLMQLLKHVIEPFLWAMLLVMALKPFVNLLESLMMRGFSLVLPKSALKDRSSEDSQEIESSPLPIREPSSCFIFFRGVSRFTSVMVTMTGLMAVLIYVTGSVYHVLYASVKDQQMYTNFLRALNSVVDRLPGFAVPKADLQSALASLDPVVRKATAGPLAGEESTTNPLWGSVMTQFSASLVQKGQTYLQKWVLDLFLTLQISGCVEANMLIPPKGESGGSPALNHWVS